MRLFIAIELPKDLKDEIEALHKPIDGIRWQSAEQVHITLKFLGDTSCEQLADLKTKLKDIQSPAFHLEIKGLDKFPAKGIPKVIWVGVSEAPKLMQLQTRVEDASLEAGFIKERHTFKPHITLARVKKEGEIAAYQFLRKRFTYSKEIEINHFTLFQSHLSAEGARHEVVKRYSLEQ